MAIVELYGCQRRTYAKKTAADEQFKRDREQSLQSIEDTGLQEVDNETEEKDQTLQGTNDKVGQSHNWNSFLLRFEGNVGSKRYCNFGNQITADIRYL